MKYGTNLLGDECLMTFSSVSGYNLQFSYSITETSFYFIKIVQLTSDDIFRFQYQIAYFTTSSENVTTGPLSSSPQKVSSPSSYQKVGSSYRHYANNLSSPFKYKATGSFSSSSSSSSGFDLLKIITTFISPSGKSSTFSSSNN